MTTATVAPPTIIIKPAEVWNLDWITRQLEAFTRWLGVDKLHETDHWKLGLKAMIENHVFLIAWKRGNPAFIDELEPVGLIAGTLAPHPFNPLLKLLCESFWWVAPEHRGSRAGLLLLKEFVRIGREKADWVTIAIETQSPIKESILLKRGFVLHEKSYLLEVR